ncbi:hypothetical protein VNX24_12935 [Citrobacter farmeri]|nr:hypothetical protein [Citrobacter farmeri]MEC3929599.1 hypothetical protein [Citrobacter farmeri]
MTPKTNCFLSSLAQILNLSLDELPGFAPANHSTGRFRCHQSFR